MKLNQSHIAFHRVVVGVKKWEMQNFCENCNNDKTMQTTEVQREIYVSLFKL